MPQALIDYRRDLKQHLRAFFTDRYPAVDAPRLADIIAAHVSIDSPQPQIFSVVVCHEGVTAMRYDVLKTLEATFATVGAVAGTPTRVQVVAGILAGLLAVRGVREPVDDDVARVVLALYANDGSATAKQIADLAGVPAMSQRQIDDALKTLKAMRAIAEDDGLVRLKERVITAYATLPRVTPR
jgi:hypothetical protein